MAVFKKCSSSLPKATFYRRGFKFGLKLCVLNTALVWDGVAFLKCGLKILPIAAG